MAKFKYRMQNILDVKLKLESQAKIAYGIANQKYLAEQKKLQELIIRRTGYEMALKELMVERKTHEKLREKAFEQFKEELKQGESKEIDELVSFTYNSK